MSCLLPLGEFNCGRVETFPWGSQLARAEAKKETRLRTQLGFLLSKMAGSLLFKTASR